MLKERQLGLTSTEFKEYLISLIGNSPYGIFTIDLLGYVNISNNLAAQYLDIGSDANSLVDRDIIESLSHIPKLQRIFIDQINLKRKDFDIAELRHKDRVLDIKGRKILNGMLITLVDITERVNINQELKNYANRLKVVNADLEEFNYISSHDLKSPISTIYGLVEMLKEEKNIKEDGLEVFSMLRKTIDITKNKIEALNRVMANKKDLHLDREMVNLGEIIDEVKETLSMAIKESKTQFHLENVDNEVYFPKPHLESVMQNLIDNAIKYKKSDTTPEITIILEETNTHDIIYVKDNGIGLDIDRYADKIFNLFYRVSEETGSGSGVGLHIVKNIINSYYGRIEVSSTIDLGTTFKILLEKKNVYSNSLPG